MFIQKKRLDFRVLFIFIVYILTSNSIYAQGDSIRQNFTIKANLSAWSVSHTSIWEKENGWLRGVNYIPSTAINQLEMWQADTFDTLTINRELAWAQELGFNCIRVFLHHVAWQVDHQGFKNRLNLFLTIASRHHIKTIFVFFDDCWNANYYAGKQPDPVIGVHNSGWLRDPGDPYFKDSNCGGIIHDYVVDVISSFKNDPRIVLWDLYNEAGSAYGERSFILLKDVFTWARSVQPTQPLTSPLWDCPSIRIISFIMANSDVITYHNYRDPEDQMQVIQNLKNFNKPIVCTEYMGRKNNSLFSNIMPILKANHVGAISWGFVEGKTNTKYGWGEPIADGSEPKLWFHDILRKNGQPYKKDEVDLIKRLTKEK